MIINERKGFSICSSGRKEGRKKRASQLGVAFSYDLGYLLETILVLKRRWKHYLVYIRYLGNRYSAAFTASYVRPASGHAMAMITILR